jgi:2-methylcitrate dehydratase PrpD
VKTAPGPVNLFAHNGQVSPAWAALVHGTAGTTLEMDEGHAYARGHAAIHAVPTALAMAQAKKASGQEAVAAAVVGYEVAARAGVGSQLRQKVHPFGAWGVLGAAAVGAWYKRSSAEDIAGTLELAASYAITPSFETAYQGATVRNTYAGMVNRLGLLAADFYELGFRGEKGGLETAFGRILGQAFDPAALTNGLGERYEIMRGYFKAYSGCRYTHAAIDAVLALQDKEAVDVKKLTLVEVNTYDLAARLTDPAPKSALAARFSTPYVVAATLINNSAGPEIFTQEMLANQEVLELAARISVSEKEDFTAMTPVKRPAQVILHFNDGHQEEKTVFGSKGDPDRPMSAAELEAKFYNLSVPRLGEERSQQAWSEMGRLEQSGNLDVLVQMLAPGERDRE